MKQPLLGLLISFSVFGIACGEATVINRTDGGNNGTNFNDGGKVTGGTDAGKADAGFMWVDTGNYDAGWIFTTFGDGGTDGGFDGRCAMTMCFTGALTRDDNSNDAFNAICDNSVLPGLIRSCDQFNCHNTFNSVTSASSLYAELFKALDTNGDNLVNAQDRGCGVNLLGFSWGGQAAVEVATAMNNDARVAPFYKRINRLFVMDPYQPAKTLTVPTNVWRFIEYRHSGSPSSDCSNGALLGPYKGLQPHCALNQNCLDYDYSMSAGQYFPDSSGGQHLGSEIGHCTVPAVAAPAIIADFMGQPYAFMPPASPVALP
jgi:hypothetical protein